LKNYHTVMVVLSGLTKAHITRLKKTWEVGDPSLPAFLHIFASHSFLFPLLACR
jgi:hypothetical protein